MPATINHFDRTDPAAWLAWSAATGRPVRPSLVLARSAGTITPETFDRVVAVLDGDPAEAWADAPADEVGPFDDDDDYDYEPQMCECEVDWNCPLHAHRVGTWIETRYDFDFDRDEDRWVA